MHHAQSEGKVQKTVLAQLPAPTDKCSCLRASVCHTHSTHEQTRMIYLATFAYIVVTPRSVREERKKNGPDRIIRCATAAQATGSLRQRVGPSGLAIIHGVLRGCVQRQTDDHDQYATPIPWQLLSQRRSRYVQESNPASLLSLHAILILPLICPCLYWAGHRFFSD